VPLLSDRGPLDLRSPLAALLPALPGFLAALAPLLVLGLPFFRLARFPGQAG
jgi:hypothetical protein